MQIIHDEIAYFHHVEVKFIIIAKQLISLQFNSQHLKELGEEVTQAAEIQIVLLEEFVTDGRSPQLFDELVD